MLQVWGKISLYTYVLARRVGPKAYRAEPELTRQPLSRSVLSKSFMTSSLLFKSTIHFSIFFRPFSEQDM